MISDRAKDKISLSLQKAAIYQQQLLCMKNYGVCPACAESVSMNKRSITKTVEYFCPSCGLQRLELPK